MEKEQKQAIKELVELLHENNLSEIDYESHGVHIRIVGPKPVPVPPPPAPGAVSPVPPVPGVPAVAANNPVPAPRAEKPVVKAENNLVSPMVGIVYLAKDPSSPNFVKVGDMVSVGQTICLIEAMKTFNPIKATKSGKIVAVLVESGSPVEYNQPLFELE